MISLGVYSIVLIRFQLLIGNLGVTLCNNIHGCRGSCVESSKRKDLANLATGQRRRSSRRRSLRRGSLGGTTKQSAVRRCQTTSLNSHEQPSEFLADPDGSLPDRPSSDIGIDSNSSDNSPESQKVLLLPTYTTNG